jgi:hypothetical protein
MSALRIDRRVLKHPDGCSWCLERGFTEAGPWSSDEPCPACDGTTYRRGSDAYRAVMERRRELRDGRQP